MSKNRNAIEKRRQAKKARKSADRRKHVGTPPPRRTAPLVIGTGSNASSRDPGSGPVVIDRDTIYRVARKVSRETPGLAYYQPEPWAEAQWCIHNVRKKVELDGGRARYGWTFNPRRGSVGPYIILAFHAVWNAPDGRLIDVTPLDPNERLRPVMPDGDTLFLFDPDAEPVMTAIGPAPMPSRAFPMNDDPELARYVAEWNEREQREVAENYARIANMTVAPGELEPRGADPTT